MGSGKRRLQTTVADKKYMEILFRVVVYSSYDDFLWHWNCCTTIKFQYGYSLSNSTNEEWRIEDALSCLYSLKLHYRSRYRNYGLIVIKNDDTLFKNHLFLNILLKPLVTHIVYIHQILKLNKTKNVKVWKHPVLL